MQYFCCDACGCQLNDRRYTVEIQVAAAFNPAEITPADLDSDHLEEIAAAIAAGEHAVNAGIEDCQTRNLRYDLCSHCREQWLRNPLGRLTVPRLNFSEN